MPNKVIACMQAGRLHAIGDGALPGRGSYPCLCCRFSSGKAVMGISFPSTFSRQSQSCSSFSWRLFGAISLSRQALSICCALLCPAWLWEKQQLWALQFVQATEDRLVEVASRFLIATVLPVFLGSFWKLSSHCCLQNWWSFGRPQWFQSQFLFLPVCGVWCYPQISISGFPHHVL